MGFRPPTLRGGDCVYARTKTKYVLALLFLSIVLAGCNVFNGGKLPGNGVPINPVDDNSGTGGSETAPLRGRIVFADTNLGLASSITINSETVTTDSGDFQVHLPKGTMEYTIRTLLGEHRDTVLHDGVGTKRLIVPAFDGWSSDYFDRMLIAHSYGRTYRWETDRDIPVWIETPVHDVKVTWQAVDTAWDAFVEWELALNGVIRFQEATSRTSAENRGVAVHFISQAEMQKLTGVSTVVGLCTVWFWPHSGYISRGEIHLVHDYQDALALHLHEIGHCIGLHHSDDWNEVMYPVILNRNRRVTEREKNAARLLYSVPPATPPLESDSFALAPLNADEDGRVKVVLFAVKASRENEPDRSELD